MRNGLLVLPLHKVLAAARTISLYVCTTQTHTHIKIQWRIHILMHVENWQEEIAIRSPSLHIQMECCCCWAHCLETQNTTQTHARQYDFTHTHTRASTDTYSHTPSVSGGERERETLVRPIMVMRFEKYGCIQWFDCGAFQQFLNVSKHMNAAPNSKTYNIRMKLKWILRRKLFVFFSIYFVLFLWINFSK